MCRLHSGKVVFTLDSFSVDGQPGIPEGVTQDDWDNDTLYVVVKKFDDKTGVGFKYRSYPSVLIYRQVHAMRDEGVVFS